MMIIQKYIIDDIWGPYPVHDLLVILFLKPIESQKNFTILFVEQNNLIYQWKFSNFISTFK